ncbi:KAP family P-loop NTPase fold protein [Parageobacillus toebii]|uniref:KAP family P-loop NTPase fold protein n=1 Tax=Parageobacillus toebii TaxID=153151 RepID=UPI0019679939|nr:P-loop NTPase fold protein [Parageobacillus toebii]QSB48934.1 hypothetical protein JTI59_00715 [Parageobacillus toebii]
MKVYYTEVKKYYSFIMLFKYSILLASALFIIDIFNFPSNYLFTHDIKVTIIISGALILFILLTAIEFHLFDAMRIVSINLIDALSIILLLTSILYGGISLIYSILHFYKIISLVIILIIVNTLIIVRAIRIKKSLEKVAKYQSNIVDLKDIYNGNFSITKGKPIMVSEKDVDYDLLNRNNVINLLYNSIQNSNPNEGFVISLEGKWGSGKTTIINNVKKKLESNKDIIIIDELDPWSYSNQESLFYSMFDIIIQKSGIKFNSLLTKQMADSIYGDLFGNKKTNIIKSFFKPIDTINVIKNRINDYLKLSGKKVVFFIDNIDRTESENIVLLFKLVGNVFDFERVIYVLSFDNDRVKKVFENNLSIDYQYLKKIIQMQIRVPEIDRNVFSSLMTRCINNILLSYDENRENLNKYQAIINCICKLTDDIRDFKRFINSVLSIPFNYINYLDKRDLLAIEYIRLNNINLYETIYRNRIYFISHDKIADSEIYKTSFNKKEFNASGKNFFKSLFEDQNNFEYVDLLQEIFPYVKKYNSDQELEYNGNIIYTDSSYPEISKHKRICSAKYFDLYFTKTENEYSLIGNIVEDFINKINKAQNLEYRLQTFNKILESVPSYHQKEFTERLQFFLDDLQDETIYDLIVVLFKNINKIDNTPAFLSLSARSRVEIIIWELLQKISEEQYEQFLENIKEDYDKLQNISNILYWFEKDREGKNIDGRRYKMEKLYQEMGARIIENSINLYQDKYYTPKNIWGLFKLYKDDLSIIKKYIKGNINEDNIFRLLYDIIVVSIGSNIKYSISNENLNYLTTIDDIEEILKNAKTKTKDQEFILEVYNNYKNDIKNEWGETGIVTDKILNLNP